MEQYPSGQPRSPAGDGRAVVVAPRDALWLLSTMISEAGAFQNGQLQMLYVFIFLTLNSDLKPRLSLMVWCISLDPQIIFSIDVGKLCTVCFV